MKKLLLSAFFFLISCFWLLPSPVAAASDWGNRCVTSATAPNGQTYNDVATIQGFECIFARVLGIIITLAGLAFLFMFISGGFKLIFSGGDQKAVAAASSTITMAIVGLVGIIASWLILKFIQDFTGLQVTVFHIPG